MKKGHKFIWVMVLLFAIMQTGCWDRREVNQRSFVMAIGIDHAQPDKKAQEKFVDTVKAMAGKIKYRVSFQIARFQPQSMDKQDGGGSGGGQQTVFINDGNTVFETVREMASRLNYSLYFEHMQVAVIGEEVAREGIHDVLELLSRDPEMRGRIKIFISEESAYKILEFEPKGKDSGGMYINQLARNHPRSFHMATVLNDIAFTSADLHADNDFVLPILKKNGDDVRIEGLAAFIDGKMVAKVGEEETFGVKLLRGTAAGGLISIPYSDGDKEGIVVVEIIKTKIKIKPRVEGDRVYFILNVALEGNVGEVQGIRQLDKEYKQKIEQAVKQQVLKYLDKTMAFIHRERVDVGQFKQRLETREPEAWDRFKGNYRQLLSTVALDANVHVVIKRVGEYR